MSDEKLNKINAASLEASRTHTPGNSRTHVANNNKKSSVSLPTDAFSVLKEKYDNLLRGESAQKAFCTQEDLTEFVNLVLFQKICRSTDQKRFEQLYYHLAKSLELTRGIFLGPEMWGSQAELFYNAGEHLQIVPSYFVKMLFVLNELGGFLCAKRGKHFSRIPQPKKNSRERMAEAAKDKLNKKVAQPLNSKTISEITKKLGQKKSNYVYVTLHLGLRPSELDRTLTAPDSYRVVVEEGYTFLDIYQGKLKAIAADKRWKRIPIVENTQQKALEILLSKDFVKPTSYELRKNFDGKVKLYSGRKGFAKSMLERGWAFEDASRMLGHSSVATTAKYYIDAEALRKDLAMSAVKRWEEKKGNGK